MTILKCPECGSSIRKSSRNYDLLGVALGNFPTLVCSKCKHQFYEEDVLDKIDEAAKKKGLWGLEHRTKLSVLGNSLAVRLSKSQT